MKKFYLLTKTLLVAVCLLAGASNAWGDIDYNYELVNQNFSDVTGEAAKWTTGGSGPTMGQTLRSGSDYYWTINHNSGNGAATAYYTLPDFSSYDAFKISFLWGMYSPSASNRYNLFKIVGASSDFATTGYVAGNSSSVTLTAGETATTLDIDAHNSSTRGNANRTTNLYKITIEGISAAADAVNNGVYLTITTEDGGTTKLARTKISDYQVITRLHFESGQFYGQNAIDDLLVQAYTSVEVVPNPSATITGVDGTNRTVTMNLGVGSIPGTVIKYYTDTESKSDLATYSAPFVVSSTSKIYYYAESTSGATSDEQSIDVTCEAVTLNAPSAYISAMTSSGSIYNPTYNATSDQTDKPLSPVATITATFKGASVSLPYTVTSSGTLAITASAEGYTSATTNIVYDFVPSYDITKSADFTEINESNLETKLDDTWTIAGSSTRWGSWSTTGGVDKDGTPNGGGAYWPVSTSSSFPITVYDFVKLNTTGTQLLIGWGFGRNSNGNTNFTIADAESTAVAEYIVSNYGNSAYSVFRYNTDNLSYNVANGVVKSVKYYTTVVPASITSTTGYATFSSTSPVNVDVEGLEAYIATGKNGDYITMEKVTGDIAANIGLVLKGTTGTTYNLPVKASGDTPSGNLLQPCDGSWTTLTKSNTGTNYVLSEQGDPKVAVFAPINKTNATLRAGVAYLYIEGGVVEARALRFSFGGITEIENVEAAAEATAKKNGAYLENGQIAIYKNGMKYNANGQLIK